MTCGTFQRVSLGRAHSGSLGRLSARTVAPCLPCPTPLADWGHHFVGGALGRRRHGTPRPRATCLPPPTPLLPSVPSSPPVPTLNRAHPQSCPLASRAHPAKLPSARWEAPPTLPSLSPSLSPSPLPPPPHFLSPALATAMHMTATPATSQVSGASMAADFRIPTPPPPPPPAATHLVSALFHSQSAPASSTATSFSLEAPISPPPGPFVSVKRRPGRPRKRVSPDALDAPDASGGGAHASTALAVFGPSHVTDEPPPIPPRCLAPLPIDVPMGTSSTVTNDTVATAATATAIATDLGSFRPPASPAVKRRPGRPRKHPLPERRPQPKRRPGRPCKNPFPASGAAQATPSNVVAAPPTNSLDPPLIFTPARRFVQPAQVFAAPSSPTTDAGAYCYDFVVLPDRTPFVATTTVRGWVPRVMFVQGCGLLVPASMLPAHPWERPSEALHHAIANIMLLSPAQPLDRAPFLNSSLTYGISRSNCGTSLFNSPQLINTTPSTTPGTSPSCSSRASISTTHSISPSISPSPSPNKNEATLSASQLRLRTKTRLTSTQDCLMP